MESVSVNVMKKQENLLLLPQLHEPEFFPECWKTLLTGVTAYVDCRTDSDNRSKSIVLEIERLGATCVAHFSKKVTHVIFKDGSKAVYDKAKKLGIPIISYLWVVACKEKGTMIPIDNYPAISSQDYDSPFFKWRKTKSMQPKDLEEELKLAERRLDRKQKKIQLKKDEVKEIKIITETTAPVSFAQTPERKSIIDTLIESSPMIQERIYQEFASGKTCDEVFSVNKGEEDDFDTFFDTPLMIKFIAKNYYSPRDPPPQSLRKILTEVQTPKTSEVDRRKTNEMEIPSSSNRHHTDQENTSPLAAMLRSGSKRKKIHSEVSSAKKIKENESDVDNGISAKEKIPRKKLFRPKFSSLVPEEISEAKTPQETPVKTQLQSHPCFSLSQSAQTVERNEVATQLTMSTRKIVPRIQPRRDSMADFRSHVLQKCHNNFKDLPLRDKPMVLVCTSLHTEETSNVLRVVDALKGCKIMDFVDDATTHVICGDSRRTLNVMRGVIRGAKILTYQWVLDSMKKGQWIGENDYGVERFTQRATHYRISKKNRRLFEDCSPIYVSSKSTIPHRDLGDLLTCAGGSLVNASKKANLIIGQWKLDYEVPCVNGIWILDCIEQGRIIPFDDYLLNA